MACAGSAPGAGPSTRRRPRPTRAAAPDLRQQLAATPVADIVANHAIGLWELAVLHLGRARDAPTRPRRGRASPSTRSPRSSRAWATGSADTPSPRAKRWPSCASARRDRRRAESGDERSRRLDRIASVGVPRASRTTRSIGDTQTAALVGDATARSTGAACPASTRGACFAALLGDERPRALADRAGRRPCDATAPLPRRHARARDRVRHRRRRGARHRLHADPGPRPSTSCGIVEGSRGRVPMRMDLTIRFDYGSIVPWVRHVDGAPRGRRRARRPDPAHAGASTHGAGNATVADFVVGRGRRGAVRARVVPVARATCPARSTPTRAIMARPLVVARSGRSSATYDGEWPRRRCSGRSSRSRRSRTRRPAGSSPRPRRRCPSGSGASATGTTATAGCATPPSRCSR